MAEALALIFKNLDYIMNTDIIPYLRERKALGTAIYYLITIPTVIIFLTVAQFNDGGPCTFGTNVAIFILAVFVTVILFCVYTILLIAKGKKYRLPFLLHLCAMSLIVAMFITGALLAR